MLSLGYRYVYAIVMSIAGLTLCLRVSENSALCSVPDLLSLQTFYPQKTLDCPPSQLD